MPRLFQSVVSSGDAWAKIALAASTNNARIRIRVYRSTLVFALESDLRTRDPTEFEVRLPVTGGVSARESPAAPDSSDSLPLARRRVYVADSIGDTRFILFVLAAFAAAPVLLAAVGLHGTLAYLTALRTRQFS